MANECPVSEFDHSSMMEVCVVCGDRASGRHYGAMSCEGCKGFFKRSIRKENGYLCRGNKDCEVNKSQRNRCQHCRLRKCIGMGMRGDSVQTERRPGRPSLNGKNKKVMPEKYNLVNNADADLGKDFKEIDDVLIHEKAVIFKSLNDLKSRLNVNMTHFHDYSHRSDAKLFDILHPSLVKFQLPFPLPTPFRLNSQFVCETASRLLFLSVHWARKISVFQSLPYSTQVSLLKNSWADLFILSLAQCKDQITLPAVLTAVASHLQTCLGQDSLSLARTRQLVNTLAKIGNIVNKVDELGLEPEEFAYLRLCSLFGSDQTSESLLAVTEPISDCVLSSFRTYYQSKNGHSDGRFARLLLHTVPLRSFPSDLLEELFFSGLVGNVKIESVIPYILGMQTGEQRTDENEEESEDDNIGEPN